ncbi:HAD-IA family hydrolase [Candidatus Saccharibacteria bacterium]|nr:HAD-IA family hydrolase [Candidatus Saccharibacteria bacterium]
MSDIIREMSDISDKVGRAIVFDIFGVLISNGKNLELFESIREWRSEGWMIGVMSNTSRGVFERCFTEVERGLFDVVVLSGEVGISKPNVGIYEVTINKLRVEVEEIVFVDDVVWNVEAAESLGMKGVVFRGNDDLVENIKRIALIKRS